jgi:hypothetical protein
MSEFPLAAHRAGTIPLEEVAEYLGISVEMVKRCIADDEDETLAGETKTNRKLVHAKATDDVRRIPGGRRQGASCFVLRRPFERYAGMTANSQPTDLVARKKRSA